MNGQQFPCQKFLLSQRNRAARECTANRPILGNTTFNVAICLLPSGSYQARYCFRGMSLRPANDGWAFSSPLSFRNCSFFEGKLRAIFSSCQGTLKTLFHGRTSLFISLLRPLFGGSLARDRLAALAPARPAGQHDCVNAPRVMIMFCAVCAVVPLPLPRN